MVALASIDVHVQLDFDLLFYENVVCLYFVFRLFI